MTGKFCLYFLRSTDMKGDKLRKRVLTGKLCLDPLRSTDMKGDKIRKAIAETILAKDRCTHDLGGNGSTTSFTDAVIERL